MTALNATVVRPSSGARTTSPSADHHADHQGYHLTSPRYASGPTTSDHPDGGSGSRSPSVLGHPTSDATGHTGEVRPAGRYEWEQIVRRARFAGAIAGTGRAGKDGRATRGGLAALTVKAVALALASYADHDGSEVRPGDATLAVDLECGIKTVRSVRAFLVGLGLLQRVRAASRGRAEEYRLTLPVDLLELVDVLTPAQHQLAARGVRETARGKRGTPIATSAPEPMGRSGGHPQETGWGGPADTPNEDRPDGLGWSGGPTENAMGWSGGPTWGGPADPRTDQDLTSSTTTDHSRRDLRTAVTVARARQAAQDPVSADVVDGPGPPARSGPLDNRPPGRAPSQRVPRIAAAAAAQPEAAPGRRHPAVTDPEQLRVITAAGAARARQALARVPARTRPANRVPGAAWDDLVAATEPAPGS